MVVKLSFENQVNIFGAGVLLLIAGYVLTETVRSRDLSACQSRYPAPTQLSLLKTNGRPMEPAELQARIGVGERGMLENASVVASDGPDAWALGVKIGAPQQNGPAVSFQWSPANMGQASSACLNYSIFLPRDLGFSQGGYLPGIIGDLVNAPKGGNSGQTGFASRPVWTEAGVVGIEANTSDNSVSDGIVFAGPKDLTLPRGRWVRIDQEVVLNTPNAQNGELRLWVDGRLAVTQTKLSWRSHGGIRISGIGADIGYRSMKTNILPTRKPVEIKVSPLLLAWRSNDTVASSK